MDPRIVVLEIYRITLLSNAKVFYNEKDMVLEIYRITLLSNGLSYIGALVWGFRDLQNYTTLKQI